MTELAEVLRTEPEERRTVELGVAPDVVVHLRGESSSVLVVPELGRPVLALDEHRRRVPVVPLARQVAAALEQQDLLAAGREPMRERPPAGTSADDDDVPVPAFNHRGLLTASAWLPLSAASPRSGSPRKGERPETERLSLRTRLCSTRRAPPPDVSAGLAPAGAPARAAAVPHRWWPARGC